MGMKGEDLKNWRKRWGVTQNELARLLGIYQETVSRWERGKRGIPSHLSLALDALEHQFEKEGREVKVTGDREAIDHEGK